METIATNTSDSSDDEKNENENKDFNMFIVEKLVERPILLSKSQVPDVKTKKAKVLKELSNEIKFIYGVDKTDKFLQKKS